MIRAIAILLALTGRAAAITPLSQAESMAWRSGEVIGAAAACGVAESRLIAVGRVTAGLISQVARDRAEAERARKLHEQVYARTVAARRDRQTDCAAAVQAFERAERN